MHNRAQEEGLVQTQRFDSHIRYSSPDKAPAMVISNSFVNLDLYFNAPVEPTLLREYFDGYTRHFLTSSLRGFRPYLESNKHRFPNDASFGLIEKNGHLPPGSPSAEDVEAFSYSLTALGSLDRYKSRDPLLGRVSTRPYSSRGILRPPQSTVEIFQDLSDFSYFMQQIIKGQIKPGVKIPDLLRMVAFFQVGHQLASQEVLGSNAVDNLKQTVKSLQKKATVIVFSGSNPPEAESTNTDKLSENGILLISSLDFENPVEAMRKMDRQFLRLQQFRTLLERAYGLDDSIATIKSPIERGKAINKMLMFYRLAEVMYNGELANDPFTKDSADKIIDSFFPQASDAVQGAEEILAENQIDPAKAVEKAEEIARENYVDPEEVIKQAQGIIDKHKRRTEKVAKRAIEQAERIAYKNFISPEFAIKEAEKVIEEARKKADRTTKDTKEEDEKHRKELETASREIIESNRIRDNALSSGIVFDPVLDRPGPDTAAFMEELLKRPF